ncbi:MAG: acyl-CoA dehydrogenase, partial [Acidimicrobiia bacterium]|nr:acyl-CoA dehydrogenase [Acidimicrobiia bacterium]
MRGVVQPARHPGHHQPGYAAADRERADPPSYRHEHRPQPPRTGKPRQRHHRASHPPGDAQRGRGLRGHRSGHPRQPRQVLALRGRGRRVQPLGAAARHQGLRPFGFDGHRGRRRVGHQQHGGLVDGPFATEDAGQDNAQHCHQPVFLAGHAHVDDESGARRGVRARRLRPAAAPRRTLGSSQGAPRRLPARGQHPAGRVDDRRRSGAHLRVSRRSEPDRGRRDRRQRLALGVLLGVLPVQGRDAPDRLEPHGVKPPAAVSDLCTAARAAVAPNVADWERRGVPAGTFEGLARDLGLSALRTPRGRGGEPLPWTEVVSVARALGRVYRAFGAVLVNNVVAGYLGDHADDAQWERWGAPIHEGRCLSMLAINEAGSGNDLSRLASTVTPVGADLRLDGGKAFLPNANRLPYLLVLAAHGAGTSMLVVPTDAPGVRIASMGPTLALRGLDLCEATFGDCRLGAEHLIGTPGAGMAELRPHLLGSRLNTAGLALGGAEEALDLAVDYTARTERFGRPLNRLGAVQQRLGDLSVRVRAAGAYLHTAAGELDAATDGAGASVEPAVSAAKVLAAETSQHVTHEAIHLQGGWGFLETGTVERLARAAA